MSPSRRYPDFYEKIIPIVLVGIGIAILVIVLISLGVASGIFSTFH